MTTKASRALGDYLNQQYRFNVIADEDGGYVVEFPDLPGCITQVEDITEVSPMAEEIRTLWIKTAFDHGFEIPDPTYPPLYSGKFNVRLPRSLHRALAESAENEGVSLNQQVVAILSGGVSTSSDVARRLDRIESALKSLQTEPSRHAMAGSSRSREGAPSS